MSDQDNDPELQWALRHAREVGGEYDKSPLPKILARFGTLDAWLQHCGNLRRADTEGKLARAIMRLMSGGPRLPRGKLRQPYRKTLLSDSPLAAYCASVALAGEDAWEEERRRISQTGQSCPSSVGVPVGGPGLNKNRIRALLPAWRLWGQVLLDSHLVLDPETVLTPSD